MDRRTASDTVALPCVVVPRWGGTADADWYPWLREQLDGSTLVGHSVGCQVVMRYLAADRRAVDDVLRMVSDALVAAA